MRSGRQQGAVKFARQVATVLALLCLGALAGCVVVPPPTGGEAGPVTSLPAGIDDTMEPVTARSSLPGVRENGAPGRAMTATLLQSELLAFADRYLEAIAEAADWGADHTDDPRVRAAFRQTKVIYVTGAITTASEPDPLRVLRDFLVLLRLQRIIWETGGHKWAAPEAAARMVRALTALDGQIVALAGRVLPTEAINIVHELTRSWRAAHKDRRYVAFVRFHDLGDSELRRRFEAHITAKGLLAPIEAASQELQEMRRVAERAIFLTNHMPLLLEWQGEALLYNTLKTPELQAAFGDLDRFASTAEDLVTEIEALPGRVADERAAAITNFGVLLQREREAAIEQVAAELRAEREQLFRDVNASAGELLPLAQQLAVASAALRETLALVAAMQGDGGGDGGGFELPEAQQLVLSATALIGETHGLAQLVQELLSTEVPAGGVAQINQLLHDHELRLFGYAACLLVLGGLVVCGVVLVLRRTQR
jgi:hypothetical protein